MGDFSDDYGGYDMLGIYEQRDDDRRAQRAKLLTPPQSAQPMHPDIKKMYEDYFDKCFRESFAAQRQWVGLTDAEIEGLFQSAAGADEETHIRFALLIQAKLKDKNA